jgi:hypothetical protein
VHRSTEGGPAGRIGRGGRRRLPLPLGVRRLLSAVPLGIVITGALCWWLLPGGSGSGAVLALLTLGGWGLGVLPVHSDRQPVRSRRRLTAQPQPARSGVEPAGLQDRAEC